MYDYTIEVSDQQITVIGIHDLHVTSVLLAMVMREGEERGREDDYSCYPSDQNCHC